MNKTININLAGIIFHLDEDAFHKLQEYLDQLKRFFKDSEGRDEIITDIEARFAELFHAKLNQSKKEVISLDDVNACIAIMGEPEAYLDDEDAQEYHEEPKAQSSNRNSNRRIFRDPDDQVLGGVCSGLGAYFNMEPLIFRLLFVVMFFGFGTGLLLYILLWIIIPEASTAAEKLQMRGEDVNASNIGRIINEEIDDLKGKFKKGASQFEQKAKDRDFKGVVGSIIDGIVQIVGFAFRLAFKLLGFGLLIIGLIIAVSLLATLFGAGPLLMDWPFELSSMADIILLNSAQYTWACIAVIIFMIIPISQLIYTAVRIIFKLENKVPKPVRMGAGIIWIISIIMLVGVGIQVGIDFDRGEDHVEIIEIATDDLVEDTLYLDINEVASQRNYLRRNDFNVQIEGNVVYANNIEMDVKKSKTDEAYVRIRTSARGISRSAALERARNTHYEVNQSGNTLRFDNYLSFNTKDKWRDQEVYVTLYVPEGMTIYLKEDIEAIVYDIDNVHNMWDGDMMEHYWEMRSRGLTCVDCLYYD